MPFIQQENSPAHREEDNDKDNEDEEAGGSKRKRKADSETVEGCKRARHEKSPETPRQSGRLCELGGPEVRQTRSVALAVKGKKTERPKPKPAFRGRC
jgi:hypothetical protein